MAKNIVKSKVTRHVLGFICGAILSFLDLRSGSATTKPIDLPPLRVAVHPALNVGAVDPALARGAEERMLARNLFGRLLEYNEDGDLVPGLVSSFEWRGRALVLTFDTHARVPRSGSISTADAARSLMRTLILRTLNEGPSANLLCDEGSPTSLGSTCSGLEVEGAELRLTPRSGVRRSRLAFALASTEFSIVPPAAFGHDLRLLDLTQTTGAYRLGPRRPDVTQLRANLEHYAFEPDMPQVIELIAVAPERAVSSLRRGDIDLLPPTLPLGEADAQKLSRDRHRFTVIESTSPLARSSRRAIADRGWTLVITPEAADLELWKVKRL